MSDSTVKENSDNDVPLTKQKGMKKEKVIDEIINKPKITITKPIKEKKPRSEKQKAQFELVAKKRKESIEQKNMEKKIMASKLLLEKDPEFMAKQKTIDPPTPHINDVQKIMKPKKEPKIIEVNNTDSESEESIIIIKRKPKKTKKQKKIIIEESESESSSDEEVISIPKPKREFITQQNKKSVIKVHKQAPNYNNYFV